MKRQDRTPLSSSYPKRPYDLVKEVSVAFLVVSVLSVILAAVFSSPDRPALTLASWAKVAPDDVVATAAGELAGTTTSAGYGPPYNNASAGQSLGFIAPPKWVGVTQRLDSAHDLVITPLSTVAGDSGLAAALHQWSTASSTEQSTWANNYVNAVSAAPSVAAVKKGNYGPVPLMSQRFLQLARSGALDGLLGPSSATGNDTKRLMLLADGSYLANQAQADHLSGDQWGMMNEAGNYPGQPWLWLYTFWYQVPGISTSVNADVIVAVIMAGLTVLLVFVPFIPGLRSVPRLLRIHRIIWRRSHP
ncbi:MAG TPA: hypothetical protein VN108_07755 [Marmoricola sp.]|nr:hypothetical protein [Marmoricola sp.]